MLALALRLAALAAALLAPTSVASAQEAAAHLKPGERLRPRLVPAAVLFEPGEPVRAELELDLFGAAGALRILEQGTGALARGQAETWLAGPWGSGSRARHEVVVPAAAGPAGDGVLRVRIEALDDFGNLIQARTALLFARVDEHGTWTSGSSDVDLELRRVQRLRETGHVDAAQAARLRSEVSRGSVTVLPGPPPTPTGSAAGHRLGQGFQLLGLDPPESQAPASGPEGDVELTTVRGLARWTDRDGSLHPLYLAPIELRVDDDVIASTTTAPDGTFQMDVVAFGPTTARVRMYARSPVGDVRPDADDATTYYVETGDLDLEPGATEELNLQVGNGTATQNAFSVHAALVLIGGYMGPLAGSLPSQLDVRFPTTASTSFFSSSSSPNRLELLLLDRHDWDVIHHEYGHYVQEIYGFAGGVGGSHSSSQNLASIHGKQKGIQLAWSEGWPTYFGLVGQRVMGGGTLGVPDVGDDRYTDTEDSSIDDDLEALQGLGEDNEQSVSTCLLDLVDNRPDGLDEFTRSDTTLFELFVAGKPQSLGDAWDVLAGVFSNRTRAEAGAVFAHNNVAPRLLEPMDGAMPEGIPTFRWKKNGGGTPNPLNDFKILFWDRDFDDKLFELELGDTDEFTPNGEQWLQIREEESTVYWVVEGRNTTSPTTSGGAIERYWSQAHRLGGVSIAFVIDDTDSMMEEIDGVKAALQQFLVELENSLEPDELPPTVQVVTFKDSVAEVAYTNDISQLSLAVQGLGASGGADCPEVGAQALAQALEEVGAGGTILFATDASSQPGADIPAVLTAAGELGIEVQVLASGDCFFVFPFAYAAQTDSGPAALLPGGPQPWSPEAPPSRLGDSDEDGGGLSGKPGDGLPALPHGPLDDVGQEPFDAHGDSPETATLLAEGAPPVLGAVDAKEDVDYDWFALDLEVGQVYYLRFEHLDFHTVRIRTYAPDGVTQIASISSLNNDMLVWAPVETGRHYVRTDSPETRYLLSYEREALPHVDTGVELYSLIANETGGVYSLQLGVNDDEGAEYVASLLNIMLGSIRPTVTVALPNDVPREATLTLTLTGSKTSWDDSTIVDVVADGVTVDAVQVLSPKRLLVTVTVAADAALGYADIAVSTLVDDEVELATGLDVIEVTEPVPFTMLLSVQPAAATRGETLDVSFSGAKTFWSASSTPALGSGITVDSFDVVSSTRIDATVTIAEDAALGFRTPLVGTMGNEDELELGFLVVNESPFGSGPPGGVLGLTPGTAQRGARLAVSVRTEGTAFEAGVTTADFGPGIEVLDVQVLAPDEAEVEVEVAVNALLGFRDVTLTTGDEVVLIEDEFFVDDFGDVQLLDGGLSKLSRSLGAFGAYAFELEATADQTLERLFVAPFGDGANGTAAPPELEVAVVSPSSALLVTQRSSSAPIDLTDVELTAAGTYRVIVLDRGGGGGAYKGIAILSEEVAP